MSRLIIIPLLLFSFLSNHDMLHLQDYKQFLEQSGWEEKVESLK